MLDEARRIGERLRELAAALPGGDVLVVDGGSTDGTSEVVASFPSVRWLTADRGRARQMNAGARQARGEALLFLHADVALPPDAAACIDRALARPGVVGGAFRTWHVQDGGRPRRLAPLLHLADLRSRYARLPYGDQALFVRAREFWAVGGFPDLPLLEDLELARRLRARGRLEIVRRSVRVSGRRFLERPVYYTLLVNLLPALYRLGWSPGRLARLYGAPR